jgi:hypothetical protein
MIGLRSTLIAAAVALMLALLLLGQCQRARNAGAEAALAGASGRAAVESGKDAVGAVGAVSARESAGNDIGRTNDAEIHAADGAAQAVPVAVDAAGRAGLCRRAAYQRDPKCMRFTPAR